MNNSIILLFAITIIAFSCKTIPLDSEKNSNSESVESVESVEKNEYEIAIGETFDVKLSSNASTGYSWNWANEESTTVVNFSGSDYVMDEPVMAGSGGNEVWTFIGVKAGEETIILEYARSWESQYVEGIKKIIVRVK
jgi:predicted secreted protein